MIDGVQRSPMLLRFPPLFLSECDILKDPSSSSDVLCSVWSNLPGILAWPLSCGLWLELMNSLQLSSYSRYHVPQLCTLQGAVVGL